MSTILPLFDWPTTERVAKATGFDPEKSPEARAWLLEMQSHWVASPNVPRDLMLKGHTFVALAGWVDANYHDQGIPLPKWIADWREQASAVMAQKRLFMDLDPETVNRVLDNFECNEMRRIGQAGYPTVIFHEPEGESAGRIEWWPEDERENDLQTAYDKAVDDMTDENDAEIDLAHQKRMAYWEDVENRTIAALRTQGDLHDLLNLIDAAARRGTAYCPENAAGWFLHRIAELAMSAITTTGGGRNE